MSSKKWIRSLWATLMAITLFLTGCDQGSTTSTDDSAKSGSASHEKKIVTVTTSFLYDMSQQLLPEDAANIELIIPAGEDPHLYVPKPEDLRKLKEADVVLYHGLHFEGKMVDALEQVGVAVSQHFPENRLGQMDEDGVMVVDPHFWFDLELYAMAVDEAEQAFIELFPDLAETIQTHAKDYKEELQSLDQYIREELAKIPEDSRYLITPHDAFNYFSRSYDIPVFAPQGVSTDTEVAVADISETVNFILEHEVKAIFAESTTDPGRMMKIQDDCKNKGFTVEVVSGEGQELFSDSLAPEGADGDTFIDMYRHNVDLIVKHLS